MTSSANGKTAAMRASADEAEGPKDGDSGGDSGYWNSSDLDSKELSMQQPAPPTTPQESQKRNLAIPQWEDDAQGRIPTCLILQIILVGRIRGMRDERWKRLGEPVSCRFIMHPLAQLLTIMSILSSLMPP